MSNDLSKPIAEYPLARPEDMPAPPPPGAPGEPAGASRRSPADVAVLDFLDPEKLRKSVTLDHPFRFDGQEVHVITVRALSVLEVGSIAGEARVDEDLYRYFAVMTGLPAAVLRAMPADDGGRVLEACDPFLPRFLTA